MGCSFSCDAKNAATPGTSQDRHARPQRPVEQSPSGNPLCLHRGTHDDFACGVGPVSAAGSPTGQSLPFIVADAVVDRRSGSGGAAAAATRASATAIRTSQVLRFRPRPHPRAAPHVAVPEVDDVEYGPHHAGAGVTSESAVTGGSFSSHASVASWEPSSGSTDLTSPLETVIQLMPEFEAF